MRKIRPQDKPASTIGRGPGRWIACGLLLMAVCVALPATAESRRLRAQIERVDAGWLQAEQIELTLRWDDDAAEGDFELRVGTLSAAALGYRLSNLHWRCPLERGVGGDSGASDDRNAGGWRCKGAVDAAGLRRGQLQIASGSDGLQIALSRARAQLALSRIAADRDGWRIAAQALPVGWLQPLLQVAWPSARLTAGSLQATLQLEADGAGQHLHGPLELRGVGLDTDDGRIAAAELTSSGQLDLGWSDDRLRVDSNMQVRGGELLVGALYVALPPTPVEWVLSAERAADRSWRVERLHWNDPDALRLTASGTLQPDHAQPVRALQLDASMPDLAVAHARYLDALLGSLGGDGLQPSGALTLAVQRDLRDWQLVAELENVSLIDARARFVLDRADGALRWTNRDDHQTSQLRWQGAALHGIALGAAELNLDSQRGWLRLQQPARVAALGGALAIGQFGWRPALDGDSPQLELALDLIDLDLSALSARFDWPAFSGRLGGSVPAARYQQGVLQFDGGLMIEVFDGRIEIAALRMERPFGIAPRLEADIALSNLDLQPLTAVFGFGEITGRLDGRIRALSLLDWQPVGFDAELRSSTSAKDKRRISRRAVADLTSIGGGALAGGLQQSALKLFDSFAYRRIGLRCRLANQVCEMGGLDSSPTGYTIVEGAGLPRITVVGHQRRVDWPVLVARLKAVSGGQAVRID